jgi:hypothetical protein
LLLWARFRIAKLRDRLLRALGQGRFAQRPPHVSIINKPLDRALLVADLGLVGVRNMLLRQRARLAHEEMEISTVTAVTIARASSAGAEAGGGTTLAS